MNMIIIIDMIINIVNNFRQLIILLLLR